MAQGYAQPCGAAMPDPERVRARLIESGEAARLAGTIDAADARDLTAFGADAARAVSRMAETAMRRLAAPGAGDAGEAIDALAEIMARLELAGTQKKPRLGFLRGAKQKDADAPSFDDLGAAMDRALVRLRAEEARLARADRQLEQLFREGAAQYAELEKHALAASLACQDLARRLARADGFEADTLRHAMEALQRRAVDLNTAGTVALQTLAMLQTLRQDDALLAQRLREALAVSLPAFRSALAQAVEEKRQGLRAAALRQVGERASEDALAAGKRALAADIEGLRRQQSAGAANRRAAREELARLTRQEGRTDL